MVNQGITPCNSGRKGVSRQDSVPLPKREKLKFMVAEQPLCREELLQAWVPLFAKGIPQVHSCANHFLHSHLVFKNFILCPTLSPPNTSQNQFLVTNGRAPKAPSSLNSYKIKIFKNKASRLSTQHLLGSWCIPHCSALRYSDNKIQALLSKSSQSALSQSSRPSLHLECQGLNYSQRIKWSILG